MRLESALACDSLAYLGCLTRGCASVAEVKIQDGESIESALRRFKRKCEKSGILSELKKRQHYEKPSTKRKRKAIAARKKVLRKLAEDRRAGGY